MSVGGSHDPVDRGDEVRPRGSRLATPRLLSCLHCCRSSPAEPLDRPPSRRPARPDPRGRRGPRRRLRRRPEPTRADGLALVRLGEGVDRPEDPGLPRRGCCCRWCCVSCSGCFLCRLGTRTLLGLVLVVVGLGLGRSALVLLPRDWDASRSHCCLGTWTVALAVMLLRDLDCLLVDFFQVRLKPRPRLKLQDSTTPQAHRLDRTSKLDHTSKLDRLDRLDRLDTRPRIKPRRRLDSTALQDFSGLTMGSGNGRGLGPGYGASPPFRPLAGSFFRCRVP